MFFWRKKRAEEDAKRERQIQNIRLDTRKKMQKASTELQKAKEEIDKLIGDDPTLNIWYATGGDRRQRNVRR